MSYVQRLVARIDGIGIGGLLFETVGEPTGQLDLDRKGVGN